MDLRPDFTVETIEVLQKKGLRQLAGAIGPEIKKENGVAVTNALFVRKREDERRHELVGLPQGILPGQRFRRRRLAKFSAAEHDCVPGLFRSVPTSIAIHGKV